MNVKTKNISNLISLSRIPFSLFLCFTLVYTQHIATLWILFILIEISDFLDGYVARKTDMVSDFGKILDPAMDVLGRIAILFSLAYINVLPFAAILLLFYREVSMMFFRTVRMKHSHALAANWLGKAKTVVYAITIGLGLLSLTYELGTIPDISAWVAVACSLCSFMVYTLQKAPRSKGQQSEQ